MATADERKNARRRARKAVAQGDVKSEIELIYEKPIEQWDDEELARGRPRDKRGGFGGSRPAWLTPALQSERQRRLRMLMADELGTFAADALRTIHSVMTDDRMDEFGKPLVSASVKLDAGKYLVDQFMGKATATVDVHNADALTELMTGILVNDDGQPSHGIIDADVVDDDHEDNDGPRLLERNE